MNSQDLYNLQEAYIGVYADLDEERAEGVREYQPRKRNPLPKEKPLSGEKGDGSGYGEDKKFTKPDDKIEKPGTTVPPFKKGGYGRISPVIPYGIGANATKSRSANSRIRRLDPGAPTSQKLPPEDKKKPSKEIIRKKTNEAVDIYDIILSHLLDEGYADTYEAAEAIMVNMSEDWRESIILEQSLPSNYTDYKSPAVQASHARSMGSASKMRQMGMNATSVDPKDDAQSNLNAVKSGNGVAKPLSGTTIKSGAGKEFKVGDPGINIGPSK